MGLYGFDLKNQHPEPLTKTPKPLKLALHPRTMNGKSDKHRSPSTRIHLALDPNASSG